MRVHGSSAWLFALKCFDKTGDLFSAMVQCSTYLPQSLSWEHTLPELNLPAVGEVTLSL